jgi:hypothetical protein
VTVNRRLLDLVRHCFGRKAKATMNEWKDQALEHDLEEQKKNADLISADEALWEQVANRTDLRADITREQLRTRLPKHHARHEAIVRRVALGLERERIVNELLRLHAEKLAALKRRFETFVAIADVPNDTEFRDFAADCHEVNILASVLFEATGLVEYRRPFDGVRALKSHWFDVNHARERLFHLVGPTNKPKLAADAGWLADAHRLTELRAGITKTEEHAHA